jgi:hypothetical protein
MLAAESREFFQRLVQYADGKSRFLFRTLWVSTLIHEFVLVLNPTGNLSGDAIKSAAATAAFPDTPSSFTIQFNFFFNGRS